LDALAILKIQVHRDRGKDLRTMDDLRWRPTSKLAYATRKARGSAGRNLRNDRFWREAAVEFRTGA
jgi:hypothetical protein